MDWNKANTILITAFIILNIFLFASIIDTTTSTEYNPNNDENFKNNVISLLEEKNIKINTKIPEDSFVLPILETEYEIIEINSRLMEQFLHERIEPMEDVYSYSNSKGETLEIIDGKKLRLTLRKKSMEEITGQLNIQEEINNFTEEKNIDIKGYNLHYTHTFENEIIHIYTENHNGFSMDNSYMYFFLDNEGIYKFEMQRISSVKEIPEKVRLISAIEALPRILTYPEIADKEIVNIQMTYYSVEDENWKNIERINSDPMWKVIFSDGTQKHLPGID
ncbi:MAG TPA: hypothetical protein GX396_03270 [Tissierellia bacterium]|nr:hypothetical protein [Tissierellia bacterium]